MNNVIVLSNKGTPLMPCSPRAARLLLKNGKAKRVRNKLGFAIQLTYGTKQYKQDVVVGIDSGYKHMGFSVQSEKQEAVGGELELRTDIPELLKERAMYRRQRRGRLRYRKPGFKNRPESWFAPSIKHKVDSQLKFIEIMYKSYPVSQLTIEVASFDIQKIMNPEISGVDYQNGVQRDYWNLREYIFYRDNHTCQICGKNNFSDSVVLHNHHIGYWKNDRTDRPANLLTVCTGCHTTKNHQKTGKLYGLEPVNKPLKATAFMNIVRWELVRQLKQKFPAITINVTYGGITKSARIELGLPKTHHYDAVAIARLCKTPTKPIIFKQVRRNNRSLEKFYDAKYIDTRDGSKKTGKELCSGRRTRNKNLNTENLREYRGHKVSKGRRSIKRQRYSYQTKDLVKYDNQVYTVVGIQNKGDYIKLKGLSKPVKTELVSPYRYMKGFILKEIV